MIIRSEDEYVFLTTYFVLIDRPQWQAGNTVIAVYVAHYLFATCVSCPFCHILILLMLQLIHLSWAKTPFLKKKKYISTSLLLWWEDFLRMINVARWPFSLSLFSLSSSPSGMMYLGGYRPVLEPLPHHTSTSNINLEEQGAENRDGQSPKHPRCGPLIV